MFAHFMSMGFGNKTALLFTIYNAKFEENPSKFVNSLRAVA